MTLCALLWDVDGTVAETERDGHRVAFNQAFQEAGLAWGWSVQRYGELLSVTGGRERLLADMATRSDAPATAAEREALARRLHARKNAFYERLVEQGAIAARPGVLALMRDAAAAGLTQAIVTTTSRSNVNALMGRLLGLEWRVLFDAVVCGEDVGGKKPDPEAYHLALAHLSLRPEHTLAIEDSTPGAQAANAAGVPLLLRPSVYFPAERMPAGLSGVLCQAEGRFDLDAVRRAHASLVSAAVC